MPFKKTNEHRRLIFECYLNTYFKLFLGLNKDGEIKKRVNSFLAPPFKAVLKRYIKRDNGWNALISYKEFIAIKKKKGFGKGEKSPYSQNTKSTRDFFLKFKQSYWAFAPIIKGLSPPSDGLYKTRWIHRHIADDFCDEIKQLSMPHHYAELKFRDVYKFHGKIFYRVGRHCYEATKTKDKDGNLRNISFKDDGGLLPIKIYNYGTSNNPNFEFKFPKWLCTATGLGNYKRDQKLLCADDYRQKIIIEGIKRWERYKVNEREEGDMSNPVINMLDNIKSGDGGDDAF